MTIEEFKNTEFSEGMKVLYEGVENEIASVDFKEMLVGLEGDNDIEEPETHWVRCENVTLLNP